MQAEWLRNAYFLIFLVLFVARNVAEGIVRPRLDPSGQQRKRGLASLALLTLPYLVSGVWVGVLLLTHRPANVFCYVAGLVLFGAGFAGRVAALRALGASYSVFLDSPVTARLVTSGIYSIIRHPIYTFYLLEMAAFVGIQVNAVSAVCFLVVGGAAIHRVRLEDAILAEWYGENAREYQRRTKRLVPFVY